MKPAPTNFSRRLKPAVTEIYLIVLVAAPFRVRYTLDLVYTWGEMPFCNTH